MNQRWAEVLCVLAAGSIARLRGDRMSICSNQQWIEFDGSKGCVNSWEFSRSFLKVKVQNGGYFFGLLKFQIFFGGV